MAYTTTDDLRFALAPGGLSDPATASSLADAELLDAINEAGAEVDARLSDRYPVPFADGAVPVLVAQITRDLAAFKAMLVSRKSSPVDVNDPVRLRYNHALALLKAVGLGDLDLAGAEGAGALVDPTVVNQWEGNLFSLDGLGLWAQWPTVVSSSGAGAGAGQAGGVSEAELAELAAGLAAGAALFESEAATAVRLIYPNYGVLHTCQFVPQKAQVELTADVSGLFAEGAGGSAKHVLFYGDPASAPLTPVVDPQVGGPPAGVETLQLGNQTAWTDDVRSTHVLSGLTVGEPVRAEIATSIVSGYRMMDQLVGGAVTYTLPTNATYIACSRTIHEGGPADVGGPGVGDDTLAIMGTVGAQNKWMVATSNHHVSPIVDRVLWSANAVSASPARPGVTPNGKKAVFPNYEGNGVTIVDRATGVATNQALAAGTGPIDVTCDDTHAWIVCAGSGDVVKLTIATPATQVLIDIGTGGDAAFYGTLNPAGTRFYAVTWVGAMIKVVNTATNAVVATIGPGALASMQVTNVAVMPDGATGYIFSGASLHTVNLINNTLGSASVPDAAFTAPQHIQTFADGRGLLVASSVADKHLMLINLPSKVKAYAWGGGAGGVAPLLQAGLSPRGTIFAKGTAAQQLAVWPGGEFTLDPASEMFVQRAKVTVRGATA